MTLDITMRKHSGVLAAFREHFVKTGLFPVEDSNAYGEAYELSNTSDFEMLGSIEREQAVAVINSAKQFVTRRGAYLKEKGDL